MKHSLEHPHKGGTKYTIFTTKQQNFYQLIYTNLLVYVEHYHDTLVFLQD
uniref:Uncharacterized protein n=1 Tax=Arundo donax TaxID=35708 RepID=A0A0A9DFQ1_ARUDO